MFDFKVIEANKDKFVVEIGVEFDGEEEMEHIKFRLNLKCGLVFFLPNVNSYDGLNMSRNMNNLQNLFAI